MQWGDEGKGKIVDFLADRFDAVVRFQGGHNAGHTIEAHGKTYKLSLLPSGVIRSKFSVIGSGVVVDPVALFAEINKIKEAGIKIDPTKLAIADNACLILSLHREVDQLIEAEKGNNKIGTTGRGIGPAYEDMVGRRAVRISDLADDAVLKERLESLVFYHNLLRKGLKAELKSVQNLMDEIAVFRANLLAYAKPAFEISQTLAKLANVMFEGAQGALLDVNFGTYPFVTSSNTIASQVAIGAGVSSDFLTKTIGVVKAYTTRVGSGFFPTELNDEIGEFLTSEGKEFGTVTGRKRRCGWFDAALIKQAINLSAVKEIVLTKLDVLDKLKSLKICVGYEIEGQTYQYFPLSQHLWSKLKPIYHEMDGWLESTDGIKSFDQLPANAQKYIRKIEEVCKVRVAMISTGANRNSTIIV